MQLRIHCNNRTISKAPKTHRNRQQHTINIYANLAKIRYGIVKGSKRPQKHSAHPYNFIDTPQTSKRPRTYVRRKVNASKFSTKKRHRRRPKSNIRLGWSKFDTQYPDPVLFTIPQEQGCAFTRVLVAVVKVPFECRVGHHS